jgi:hypothetical protein
MLDAAHRNARCEDGDEAIAVHKQGSAVSEADQSERKEAFEAECLCVPRA